MERMPMCRICLVENVRMYIVVDKDLHELYEMLTDIPFVTEDRRPMLACFLCFAKLKQCCQLQRKCLEAEELFAQMMNEPNPLVNQGQLEYSSGLIISPVENISITGCGRLDDVIEPEEEHQSDDVELKNVHIDYLDLEDTPALHGCESYSEDNVPLMELKTEEEEKQDVSRKKRRASDTTRAADTMRQKLHVRGKNLEDGITENQKKNEESDTKVTQNTQNYTSKLIPTFQEILTHTTPRVNISTIDTTSDTNCRNNIKKSNLTKHTRILTGRTPYKCDICQHSCKKKGNLIKHIRVHTGEKPYECEECRLCFSQKGNLMRHIRTHTGEKPYKCEECQLCFSEKGHLIRHIRTHSGKKPFKCDICLRSFIQKSDLTRHHRIHAGEKPFKCEVCQSCFSEKGNLTSHIRTHTGEKPYKCEECQLCFSRKSSLTQHIRTHTGGKPYKCDECELCFNHKSSIRRHICRYAHRHKTVQM